MMKLNLGCGNDVRDGFVNVDIDADFGVDMVHNLDQFPWPFKDNSIDYIHMQNIIEHLEHPVEAIKECHRILKKGGRLWVQFPYYNHPVAWGQFTHRRVITKDCFEQLSPEVDTDATKKILFRNNEFGSLRFSKFSYKYQMTYIGRWLGPLANIARHFCDVIVLGVEVELIK